MEWLQKMYVYKFTVKKLLPVNLGMLYIEYLHGLHKVW